MKGAGLLVQGRAGAGLPMSPDCLGLGWRSELGGFSSGRILNWGSGPWGCMWSQREGRRAVPGSVLREKEGWLRDMFDVVLKVMWESSVWYQSKGVAVRGVLTVSSRAGLLRRVGWFYCSRLCQWWAVGRRFASRVLLVGVEGDGFGGDVPGHGQRSDGGAAAADADALLTWSWGGCWGCELVEDETVRWLESERRSWLLRTAVGTKSTFWDLRFWNLEKFISSY